MTGPLELGLCFFGSALSGLYVTQMGACVGRILHICLCHVMAMTSQSSMTLMSTLVRERKSVLDSVTCVRLVALTFCDEKKTLFPNAKLSLNGSVNTRTLSSWCHLTYFMSVLYAIFCRLFLQQI